MNVWGTRDLRLDVEELTRRRGEGRLLAPARQEPQIPTDTTDQNL